jgi:hypothetical protein
MDPKFVIFIILSSFLTMPIFSSTTNFVSAASECFGEGSLDHVFCFSMIGEPPQIHVFECVRNAEGNWDCHGVTKKATPPGVDQIIQNTFQEVGPSSPNDSNDLGGMKTDKGITKGPIK